MLIVTGVAIAAPDNEHKVMVTPFHDVSSSDANVVYINYMAKRGIMNGFPDGSFHPAQGLTRAQAAVLVTKVSGLKANPGYNSFNDVNSSHWAAGYINAAAAAGYITGFPDGSFHPEESLTRAQGISLFLRLSKEDLTQAKLPQLQDINSKHWAANNIAVALSAEMIGLSSDGKKFYPDQEFRRGDLARALSILLNLEPSLSQLPLNPILTVMSGEVTVQRSNSEITVNRNLMIQAGDTITTAAGSEAELSFPDGSGLLLKSDTILMIKETQGKGYIKNNGNPGTAVDWLEVELKTGKIFGALASTYNEMEEKQQNKQIVKSRYQLLAARDNRLDLFAAQASKKNQQWYKTASTKKVKVKVDMPWGVAAIRGSFWSNTVTGNNNITTLLEGSADMSSGGQTQLLNPGQSTMLAAWGQPPAPPVPMSPQQLNEWVQQGPWVQQAGQNIMNNQPTPPTPPPPPDVPPLVQGTPPPPGTLPGNQGTSPPPSLQGLTDRLSQALSQAAQGTLGMDNNQGQTNTQNSQSPGSSTSSGSSSSGGSSGESSGGESPRVIISSISSQEIERGATLTINVTTQPSSATVTASSSNEAIAPVRVSDHSLSITGKAEGTATIIIKAIASGYVESTTTFNVTVGSPPPPIISINDLSATPGDQQVILSWSPAVEASSIKLEISTDYESFNDSGLTIAPTAGNATLTGLTNGTTYWFKLVVTGGINAGDSNVVSAIPELLCELSGTISLPGGIIAPAEGVTINIVAFPQDGDFKDIRAVNQTINAGFSSVDYCLAVPDNQTYQIDYSIQQGCSVENRLVSNGYYSNQGAVSLPERATSIKVAGSNQTGINFTLLQGNLISGTISGETQLNGQNLSLSVFNDSGEQAHLELGQLTGDSWNFCMIAPAANGYRLSYCIWSESDIHSYVKGAFYKDNANSTTVYTNASLIDLANGDKTNIDFPLLPGKKITGRIMLPQGHSAPNDDGMGIIIKAYAENLEYANTIVEIQSGQENAGYTLKAPVATGYRLEYYICHPSCSSPSHPVSEYVRKAYKKGNSSTNDYMEADVFNLTDDLGNQDFQILTGNRIYGKISLPSGDTAPPGGIAFAIHCNAEDPDFNFNYHADTIVSINAGDSSANYVVTAPPASNYHLWYYLISETSGSYIRSGYYNETGMVTTYDEASNIDINTNDEQINLTVLTGNSLSGTISLPNGNTAPTGGLQVEVRAFDCNQSNLSFGTSAIIPAGKSEANYNLAVPAGEYRLCYYLQPWAPDQPYIYSAYYSSNGMVETNSLATPITIDTNKSINLTMLIGESICGTISLPEAEAAPTGGLPLEIHILPEHEGIAGTKHIIIPSGLNSYEYNLQGLYHGGYIIGYRIPDSYSGTEYVREGYYGSSGMSSSYSGASIINTSENPNGINLFVIPGITITGTLYLPTGNVAPNEGLVVDIEANNSANKFARSTVTIPANDNSIPYCLTLEPGEGYVVFYNLHSSDTTYIQQAYYKTKEVTTSQLSEATPLNLSSEGITEVDLTILIDNTPPQCNTDKSTTEIDGLLELATSRTVTATARTEDGTPISGYRFILDIDITNDISTTAEIYTIDGVTYTTGTTGTEVITPTDANGTTTFTIALPSSIDSGDGVSVKVKSHNIDFPHYVINNYMYTEGNPAPVLTAASTAYIDDTYFDITFTDNVTWRSAITEVVVGGVTLYEKDGGAGFNKAYELGQGYLRLHPIDALPLQYPGQKYITVKATVYKDAAVLQMMSDKP